MGWLFEEHRRRHLRSLAYVDGYHAAGAYLSGETDEYRCPYPKPDYRRTAWEQGWADREDENDG